jgi:hypothetical protein
VPAPPPPGTAGAFPWPGPAPAGSAPRTAWSSWERSGGCPARGAGPTAPPRPAAHQSINQSIHPSIHQSTPNRCGGEGGGTPGTAVGGRHQPPHKHRAPTSTHNPPWCLRWRQHDGAGGMRPGESACVHCARNGCVRGRGGGRGGHCTGPGRHSAFAPPPSWLCASAS